LSQLDVSRDLEEAGAARNRAAITELGLRYGLVSPFTSFVAWAGNEEAGMQSMRQVDVGFCTPSTTTPPRRSPLPAPQRSRRGYARRDEDEKLTTSCGAPHPCVGMCALLAMMQVQPLSRCMCECSTGDPDWRLRRLRRRQCI
jgi:hypothetical protein